MDGLVGTRREKTPQENLSDLVSAFEKKHEAIVEALRLFGISNAEYERAMKALNPVRTSATASTHPHTHEDSDAFVG